MTSTKSMPACGMIGLPKNTYCLELIFNSCTQDMCNDCPIRNPSKNIMKLENALNYVIEAMTQSKDNGFKGLEVHLIGGDSLTDWTRFVKFCEGLWHLQKDRHYPIQISATTCGFRLDEDKADWLLKNSWRLKLIFRWNGKAGRQAWDNFSALKYHTMTQEVDYCLSKSNFKDFVRDLQEIIAMNKRIVIEFLDLEEWNEKDFTIYYEQLKIIAQSHKDAFVGNKAVGECTKRLHTMDVFGKRCPCRYFSFERLTLSSLRDIREEYDNDSACPVKSYFLNMRSYRNLNHVQF